MVGVSIVPSSIVEKFRITHIALDASLEKKWKEECAQYSTKSQPTCRKLIDGSEYCGSSYSYVPPYCYAGSTVETYFASQMWNYQSDFIQRVLYTGDVFYSVADGSVKSWSFSDTRNPKASLDFPESSSKKSFPVPMMAK